MGCARFHVSSLTSQLRSFHRNDAPLLSHRPFVVVRCHSSVPRLGNTPHRGAAPRHRTENRCNVSVVPGNFWLNAIRSPEGVLPLLTMLLAWTARALIIHPQGCQAAPDQGGSLGRRRPVARATVRQLPAPPFLLDHPAYAACSIKRGPLRGCLDIRLGQPSADTRGFAPHQSPSPRGRVFGSDGSPLRQAERLPGLRPALSASSAARTPVLPPLSRHPAPSLRFGGAAPPPQHGGSPAHAGEHLPCSLFGTRALRGSPSRSHGTVHPRLTNGSAS
jgi:hypothetical protein